MADILSLINRLQDTAIDFTLSGRERDRDELHAARRAIVEAFKATSQTALTVGEWRTEAEIKAGVPLVAELAPAARKVSSMNKQEALERLRDGVSRPVSMLEREAIAQVIDAIVEREAELVKALEPFAAVAEHDIGETETDQDWFRPMTQHNRAPRLTVGHLRAARAAINPSLEQE